MCAATAVAHADDGISKGRALAERLCATCHLAPGQGEKKSAAEIPGFYAIARRPNQTEEGIRDWLRSIPTMMPNHHLSQDEMGSLAQFIMSLRDGTQQP
jgi:cytochrome c553